jgi:hypothetical protein
METIIQTVDTADITAANAAAYHAATHTTKGKKGHQDMCNQREVIDSCTTLNIISVQY